jgi:hypothetical protein
MLSLFFTSVEPVRPEECVLLKEEAYDSFLPLISASPSLVSIRRHVVLSPRLWNIRSI